MTTRKIFLTVGTQLPFERLLTYAKNWSQSTSLKHEIYAQTFQENELPIFHAADELISAEVFNEWFSNADCVISHAGMGTIISAAIQEKEIIVVPRVAVKGEHRNNHQVDTANRFSDFKFVHVVHNQKDFNDAIERILKKENSSKKGADVESLLGGNLKKWIAQRS